MIDPHATPEIEGIIRYGAQTGINMKVTSTIRPGAVTISGNASFHSVGQAVDFAGPVPSVDSNMLADIFRAFLPVEAHLAELIYAGPQVSFNVKNGRRVGKYAQSIHHNHVHVAVQRGVLLDALWPAKAPAELDEAPDDDERNEDMADPVGAMPSGNGGVWVVTRDGGVRAYRNAPFYGSYPGLPPEARQGTRTFVDISERDDGLDGYQLHASDGAAYRFP